MDYLLILFIAWTLIAMALGAFGATFFRRAEITNHVHVWNRQIPADDDDPADAWKDGLDDS